MLFVVVRRRVKNNLKILPVKVPRKFFPFGQATIDLSMQEMFAI